MRPLRTSTSSRTSVFVLRISPKELVRTSVYNDGLAKEQQKNRCFFCQRFGNLYPVFPGSQSLNLAVIRTRSKIQHLSQAVFLHPTAGAIVQTHRHLVKPSFDYFALELPEVPLLLRPRPFKVRGRPVFSRLIRSSRRPLRCEGVRPEYGGSDRRTNTGRRASSMKTAFVRLRVAESAAVGQPHPREAPAGSSLDERQSPFPSRARPTDLEQRDISFQGVPVTQITEFP